MGLARTLAVTLTGLDGHLVDVEAHSSGGIPGYTLVGLPDAAVRESRDRVRAALVSCGFSWGEQRTTVNLSPADLPKAGTGFDLPLALAVLGARGIVNPHLLEGVVHLGELGLDGSVRPVRGVLPAVAAAVGAGIDQVVVAEGSAGEAALVPGAEVTGVSHLTELVARYGGEVTGVLPTARRRPAPSSRPAPASGAGGAAARCRDLADVVGQAEARHALEVAAAGGHHLLMVGAAGAGKTMIAERLPSILPDLTAGDAVTVTSIHSVAGTFDPEQGLLTRPPLCSPHHTASRAAVVGGGSGIPRPGDVSLAHRGVLLLDEAPEFAAGVLDCLRQPLESGTITIDRAGGRATFPAAFQLVLAANPCPCGRGAGQGLECTCTSLQRRRYFSRLSGPLLDRVDIQIDVGPVQVSGLSGDAGRETSATVAARVAAARLRARRRLAGTPWSLNAEVPGSWLRSPEGGVPQEVLDRLLRVMEKGVLTLRGVDRVLRLAWTLTDLAGREMPTLADLGGALALRTRGGSHERAA